MRSQNFMIRSLMEMDNIKEIDKMMKLKQMHPKLQNVNLNLEMKELWKQFSDLGTEMIVTKCGRRMFPTLQISATGMDPGSFYNIMVDFIPMEFKRYRYSYHRSAWVVAGPSDPELPSRIYPHFESPAIGSHWMRQVINFDKLKITNNQMDTNGHIVLNSMHRYQPRIHVSLHNISNEDANYQLVKIFVFPETAFMAVTAYQNQRITNLKIASNPFAKGFRESENEESFWTTIHQANTFTPKQSVVRTIRPHRTNMTSSFYLQEPFGSRCPFKREPWRLCYACYEAGIFCSHFKASHSTLPSNQS